MDYDLGSGKKPINQRRSRERAPTSPANDDKINQELASGYIKLIPDLWSELPKGAYIRYVRKDDGTGKSRTERFKAGCFVKSHSNKDNDPIIWVENMMNGSKTTQQGYISYPLKHSAIEDLWKKFNPEVHIEMRLIQASLAEKNVTIRTLEDRIAKLEARNK